MWSNSRRRQAEPGGGLLRSEWGVGGDQLRQVLPLADLRDLVGVQQRAVQVRAQLGEQPAVDEAPHDELLPSGQLRHLPCHKQYFSAALGEQARTLDASAPLLTVECGLIDRAALHRETAPAALLALAAVEQWLLGAVERGAVL
ncbi:hypothetical protein [Streptomyces sp. V1I1]|uniref:hypothetical protein n=1 Tax=Streptomyces sp. V1I1 TaxID=3042272 RepID=UPI00277E20C4|nr:hypothetical protein [Streptomyces sp. V1I1]